MLKYETPDMKVIYFEAEDILTTSTDKDTGEGEDPW